MVEEMVEMELQTYQLQLLVQLQVAVVAVDVFLDKHLVKQEQQVK